MSADLNQQQRLFVLEYLKDLNATQAAIRAGYSKKTAAEIGYENLRKPQIAEEIQKAMKRRANRLEISAERVLKEIAKVAFSDVRDVVTWDEETVKLTPSDQIDPDAAGAISEVSQKVKQLKSAKKNEKASLVTYKVKMYDKMRALEMLARHLGLKAHGVPDPSPQVGEAAPPKMSFEEFCINAGYPQPYPKQIEMMEFGINSEGARLILGARGYGKSDYVVILGIAYKLYLDPHGFRVLIITKSQERNAAMLREIANACEKAGVTFEVNNSKAIRTTGLLGKDHSVSTATIKSVSLRGRHPDLVIMDDPVTPDDVSEATRKFVKRIYNEVNKLTKNVLIIGQPVHKFDLYADLRPLLNKMEVAHGAIPELDADLEAQRLAGVDEASIQASYFLKIISEGKIPFDNIKYLDAFPVSGAAVAFIDPAFGGQDYTAVSILKAYGQGVAVVGFAWQKSWEYCLDDIAEAFEKYGVKRVAFETNKTGEQPLDILRAAFKIGVVGVFSNSNKHSRIMAAGTFAHMLHLSKESNTDYKNQVIHYEDKAKHDDAPDSLASGLCWLGLIRGKESSK